MNKLLRGLIRLNRTNISTTMEHKHIVIKNIKNRTWMEHKHIDIKNTNISTTWNIRNRSGMDALEEEWEEEIIEF